MRNIREITGILAMIGGVALSAYSFVTLFGYMPPIINDWRVTLALGVGLFVIGVLLYLLRLENTSKAKAVLDLKEVGFETKRWGDNTYTVHAYIDVSSPSVSFINTYPTITWTNEQGVQIDENGGRWFISNEDRILTTTDALLSVDLEANGKPRRLHFTTNNRERKLYSWWRSSDGYNKSKLITDSPAYIIIFLKASNGETAQFRFRITHSSDVLRLERLNNKNQVIKSAREFKYTELLDKEKVIEPEKKESKPKTPETLREKIRPSSTLVQRFSSNLEKTKKERIKGGWEITGLGLSFLEQIKDAPPFLGIRHAKSIISASDEQTLTEFFLASIYMEKYRNVIKGGKKHIVRDGENNPKAIAKAVYGHERYEVYVPGLHTYSIGMVLTMPYLNLERPDHPDEIKRIVAISKDIEGVISLLSKYNLTRKEAIPLLRMIYDVAQKTLYPRKT